eukprot:TCONS_00016163-protein
MFSVVFCLHKVDGNDQRYPAYGFDESNKSNYIVMEDQALIKWSNSYLQKRGLKIRTLDQLEDGTFLLTILEEISGDKPRQITSPSKNSHPPSFVRRNWATILNTLGLDDHLIDKVQQNNARFVKEILWRIILQNQIPTNKQNGKPLHQLEMKDFNEESSLLLEWVNRRLPTGVSARNWTTDWTDGLLLCHLINAIRPGVIPADRINQNVQEVRIRAAFEGAENQLGVPDLILPDELVKGQLKQEVLVTYIAFLRDVAGTESPAPKMASDSDLIDAQQDAEPGIPYQFNTVVAFGSGLRWGQVGKPCEFVLRVQPGAQLSDLYVYIDCKPYDRKSTRFRPELQIKPLDARSNMVRYTPTRPGIYTVSIFYKNEHILNSPFRVRIKEMMLVDYATLIEEFHINSDFEEVRIAEKLNEFNNNYIEESLNTSVEEKGVSLPINGFKKDIENSYDSHHDSAFVDDDSLRSLSVSSDGELLSSVNENDDMIVVPPESLPNKQTKTNVKNFKIFGRGLHHGEVGCLSKFHVHTPTYFDGSNGKMQGPLCVSITCPAMSIPVPFVRTNFSPEMLEHQVVYVPTEPGIYEVSVKWGHFPICGSPFRLSVSDCVQRSTFFTLPEQNRLPLFRNSEKLDIFLYYSASCAEVSQHQRKNVLEKLLRVKSPNNVVYCVPVDIELTWSERRVLLEKANFKKLPFAFVNDEFLGCYDKLVNLNNANSLARAISEMITKLRHKIRTT